MYALALLGLRCSAAAFAWQAWGLLHCRGSDVRFGAPWSPLLCPCFRVAGVGLGAPAGGLMYALALLGLRCSAAAFAWQAWDLLHCRGSDVRFGAFGLRCSTAAFAWQAWDLLHCRGSDVRFALLGLRCSAPAFAWQVWDLLHCRGSDVRFGAPWSPLRCRCFRVADVGLAALQGV